MPGIDSHSSEKLTLHTLHAHYICAAHALHALHGKLHLDEVLSLRLLAVEARDEAEQREMPRGRSGLR